MIRSRLGLRALALSALVLGLMAFVTSGVAQATAGAKWTYINPSNGKLEAVTKALLPVGSATLEEKTTAALEFTTGGGTKVTISCTSFALEGSSKLLESGGVSEGQVTFKGCETFLNGVKSAACLPKTNKGPFDVVQTNKATGLLELHTLGDGKKHHVVKLTPVVKNAKGEPLAETVELGSECSIGESVSVTGSLVLYDCPVSKKTISEHAVTHLMEEFPALRLLKALGQPTAILGSVLVFLTGTHLNFEWAGLTT